MTGTPKRCEKLSYISREIQRDASGSGPRSKRKSRINSVSPAWCAKPLPFITNKSYNCFMSGTNDARKLALFLGDITIFYVSLFAVLMLRYYGTESDLLIPLHLKPFSA